MKKAGEGDSNLSETRDRSTRMGTEHLLSLAFIVDCFVIIGAMTIAYFLRFNTALNEWGGFTVNDPKMMFSDYVSHIALGTSSLAFLLVNAHLYEKSTLLSFREVSQRILKSVVLWVLVFLGLALVLKLNPSISRVFCFLSFGTILLSLFAWRYIFYKTISKERFASAFTQKILFVGWTPESEKLFSHIQAGRHRFDVIGAIAAPGENGYVEEIEESLKLGTFQQIESILRTTEVDMVIVADLNIPRPELIHLANQCEKEMVDFMIIPSGFQILISGLHLEHIRGVPLLSVSSLPLHSSVNVMIKRTVDILGGTFGLLITAPMIFTFGLLIWLESKGRGGVFYTQRRLGQRGKQFDMFKLRSMKPATDDGQWLQKTLKDDPRRTKVGTVMRRWNIDEVPQFWNVVKGDMSLVGPRPEVANLIGQYKEEIPHYNARHNIKPGLTGWAQVNGLRGDTDLGDRVKFDLFYIENWSLFLDIKIMLMTFFRREGAC